MFIRRNLVVVLVTKVVCILTISSCYNYFVVWYKALDCRLWCNIFSNNLMVKSENRLQL